MAWYITTGNVAGIVLGQIAGDLIKNFRMKEITARTSVEDAYELSQHYGALIWDLVIFAALLTGERIHKIKVTGYLNAH